MTLAQLAGALVLAYLGAWEPAGGWGNTAEEIAECEDGDRTEKR